MAIQGFRNTGNFVVNERPESWREGILMLYPNGDAPLTALTNLMKKRRVEDYHYHWWTKALANRKIVLTTAALIGDTALVVTNALSAKKGDILYCLATKERLRVSADPTTDTGLTVERGFAGSTAAAIPITASNDPRLLIIGSAYEQGSAAPKGVSYNPAEVSNYTQIFRNNFAMTRTASRTKLRTVEGLKEAKRETLEIHSIDMERAFIFGKKSLGTENGQPMTTSDGVLSILQTYNPENILAAGATTSLIQLEAWMEKIFAFGSSEKLAFCGNRALTIIQQIVRKNSQYQVFANEKEYGMNVMRISMPYGTLVLKSHKLFNDVSGYNGAQGLDSNMLVLDAKELGYVYVDDTTYDPKQEANGTDGMESGFLTECGLEWGHSNSHFYIEGLTAAAVDA